MAFTNQLTISVADFISKLNTFLSAQGWTTHHVPASGEFAAEKNPSGSTWITMATQWDTATPQHLGIYQWHGATYNAGNSPWNQNNDSGNGAASTSNATLAGQRHVNLGASGPQEFWCFEDDGYAHIVIRRDTDIFEHFGFGLMLKRNDWTGGEYCYGHAQDVTFSSQTAVRRGTSVLLDGLAADDSPGFTNMEERCATIHVEGMAEQAGAEIWAVVLGAQNAANLGVDRAANDRIHFQGGYRSGPLAPLFGQFAGTIQRGLVPGYPIMLVYWNRTTNNVYFPMGFMPDVRGVQMKHYGVGQEIDEGGNTWVVFPSYRYRDTGSGAGFSNRQGIAYKQVS